MSESEALGDTFAALASDVSALCAEAIDQGKLDDIPNDSVGQLFASVLRLYAEKSQAGVRVRPFGRNSGVSATDVAIGCIALLEAANIEIFELGAWQRLTSVNRQKQAAQHNQTETE